MRKRKAFLSLSGKHSTCPGSVVEVIAAKTIISRRFSTLKLFGLKALEGRGYSTGKHKAKKVGRRRVMCLGGSHSE